MCADTFSVDRAAGFSHKRLTLASSAKCVSVQTTKPFYLLSGGVQALLTAHVAVFMAASWDAKRA